uniref:Uncharacterized protein n=1 Tax=Panagrolaimus sp. JU765 TaxID=591449 RepID=A0AC34PYT9_9BILA
MSEINDEAFKKSTEFFSICSETDVQNAVSDLKSVLIPLLAHYPINLMRNEARKGATTPLIIVADTENFFSKNFAINVRNLSQKLLEIGHEKDVLIYRLEFLSSVFDSVENAKENKQEWAWAHYSLILIHPNFAINVRNLSQKLLETGHEKDVLIYRRFEMESSAKFPENLNETLQLFKNKKLFEFHSHVYREGHSIPNLDEWFNYGIANDVVTKTPIQFTRANWEPQFIFSTIGNPPFHNELVPTRFQDHQFFVNEICRAGYKFHLLSHVYNIHYGVKKRSSDVEKLLVTVARNPGQKLLKNFRNYLNEKYPDTKNSCPDFKA